MTDRVDQLSERARWFLEQFDEVDLAAACASEEAAKHRAEAELTRLRAGEEAGGDERVVPTPSQWIARFNQASPEQRLYAAERAMANGEVAERCFLMAHEKRLDQAERAESALARVRELRDRWLLMTLEPGQVRRFLDEITGIVDQAPGAATEATQPPLLLPPDMATTLHRTLGQLLGDQDAQAVARLRALHREEYGSCAECTHAISVLWPCPTIRALDGEEQ
ncbi:hypothetical protein [Streptomyces sp. 1222.5]|uniref:hypothetical protein n=1 Tax=Streptomyces sp. 1222.5 TaxID=1881026 RepID=UPI003EBA7E69